MKNATRKIYRDKRGKYRWRVTASNGKIIGASTQGYSRRADALANIDELTGILLIWQ
jgi:uncharacterized protein YegP (UPF0339 family)